MHATTREWENEERDSRGKQEKNKRETRRRYHCKSEIDSRYNIFDIRRPWHKKLKLTLPIITADELSRQESKKQAMKKENHSTAQSAQ